MSDETIITAKEIEVVEKVEEKNEEVVEKIEEKNEEVVANVQEEDINTNVDSTNEDIITSDKDKKTTSSLSEILYTIKQNISYRKNVGCKGTFILCLNLFLIGLYIYGFVEYEAREAAKADDESKMCKFVQYGPFYSL